MAGKAPLASMASALSEVLQGASFGAPGAQVPLSTLWSAAPPAGGPPPRATVLCFLRRLG
jgi:hypothetical protein